MQSASTPDEIKTAFTMLTRQRIGALLIAAEPFFFSRRCQLAALASDHALLAGYPSREYAEAGGLFSYGPSFPDAWRLAGNYAGRILKGEKAGDLPVQQSMRIELIINIKTAKAHGIAIPAKLLAVADEVIE